MKGLVEVPQMEMTPAGLRTGLGQHLQVGRCLSALAFSAMSICCTMKIRVYKAELGLRHCLPTTGLKPILCRLASQARVSAAWSATLWWWAAVQGEALPLVFSPKQGSRSGLSSKKPWKQAWVGRADDTRLTNQTCRCWSLRRAPTPLPPS